MTTTLYGPIRTFTDPILEEILSGLAIENAKEHLQPWITYLEKRNNDSYVAKRDGTFWKEQNGKYEALFMPKGRPPRFGEGFLNDFASTTIDTIAVEGIKQLGESHTLRNSPIRIQCVYVDEKVLKYFPKFGCEFKQFSSQ